MRGICIALVLGVLSLGGGQGHPKFENEKGFVPSKGDYFHAKGDQVAMESHREEAAGPDRPARYGFPTYTTDVQTPGNVVPGLYGPVKLDIGGLVLGTIVGLGAFFILPKLLSVISGPHGGFKRSEDGSQPEGYPGIGELVTKVQDGLASYNIDSTACMQRAVCSSVRSASEKVGTQNGSALDNIIDNVAKNDMVKSLVTGTEWRRALEAGQSRDNCSAAFTKCPFTVDSVVAAVSKYLGGT